MPRKVIIALSYLTLASGFSGFSVSHQALRPRSILHSSEWNSDGSRGSVGSWKSSTESSPEDWEEVLRKKEDGSYWTSFEDTSDEEKAKLDQSIGKVVTEDMETEAWLDTLASISAGEVEFNMKEAERANTARQMEEWGFDREVIAASLEVSTDTSLEEEEVEGMAAYREESFIEEVDLATVESHTTVERDEETGDPIRTQMVYVDEHTCIGCTNCAVIAQSTFYMNEEHGRARVFQQWGDDDETIQIAIDTCPVNCIHYIPYEELVELEIDRRGQNINFKSRLVNGSENSHMVGSDARFTAPQTISGNSMARCNNCPSRGCKNCPMFGVGKNPEFERREKERKARRARRLLQEQRESEEKKAEL